MTEARYDEGLAALAEAVTLDPTDVRSTRRIVQAFRALKNPELEEVWAQRYQQLSRSITLSGQVADGQSEKVEELATVLESLGRNLEAVMWRAIAAGDRGDTEAIAGLNQTRLTLIENGNAFPTRADTLLGWPETSTAVIRWDALVTDTAQALTPVEQNSSNTALSQSAVAGFEDVSQQIGLAHHYKIGIEPRESGFSIYQQNGGGVAVIDYDLDGADDLYLAQGAAEPPEFVAIDSDRLFRFVRATQGEAGQLRCIDQTKSAGLWEDRYTLGVTSGDWNQDGFPDLAVANIGPEVLMINQGDGTFRIQIIDSTAGVTTLSTSLAMADLSGDGLPDLYVANYLNDPDIAAVPKQNLKGEPASPMTPHNFKATLDWVAINNGSGGFEETQVGRRGTDENYGLGLMVADFVTDHPGNEVFVANDAKANQLWSYVHSNLSWEDSAVTRGSASAA